MEDELPISEELRKHEDAFGEWCDQSEKGTDRAHAVGQQLYHYTGMSGLLGILSSEKIWFTSILYLNDPSEFGYGLNFAIEILEN